MIGWRALYWREWGRHFNPDDSPAVARTVRDAHRDEPTRALDLAAWFDGLTARPTRDQFERWEPVADGGRRA